MTPYHGGPIWPEAAALRVWQGRHGMVSFARPDQIKVAAGVCQSFCLDNGAFSVWRAGKGTDWPGYYEWCAEWLTHPGCDFAVIPDVIDGDEKANDALLADWPFHRDRGAPVWHMHESVDRLYALCEEWPRVAIGSSAQFAKIGNLRWWNRMNEAMNAICENGRPKAKLHGLRMLDPEVFTRIPFASADSTNVARNIVIDSRWTGAYSPANKETRAQVLAERIELYNAASEWKPQAEQMEIAA